MKAITIALCFTLVLFCITLWHVGKSYQDYKVALSRDYQFQFLINSLNSGPTMTTIVREASKTGNLEDENVYRFLAKEVDSALKQILKIVPDEKTRAIALKLDEANTRLAAWEERAFDLAHRGRLQDAQKLVYSDEYRNNVDIFDTCNAELADILKKDVEQEVNNLRNRAFIAFAAIVVSLPILVFVWVIVLGIVNRHLLERKEKERQNMVFVSLEQQLSVMSTPKEAAEVIMRVADDLFGWDSGYVVIYSEEKDRFYPVINYDIMEGERKEILPPLPQGMGGRFIRRVLSEGAKLILRKSSLDEDPEDIAPFGDMTRKSSSLMFVPLRKGNTNVGILSIQSYTPGQYDISDLELLQVLADHCSGALDRTLAEAKLFQSEEKLRLLMEQIPALLWTTDIELRFTLLIGAGVKALNLDSEQILGKTPYDFFQTGDPAFPPLDMHRQALKGASSHYEMERLGRFFDSYVGPLHNSKGEIIGCFCVAHDITERKQAEEELLKTHEELEKRVEERTRDLVRSNTLLKQEILERKRAEEALARSEKIYREAIENASGVPYRLIYEDNKYDFMGREIKTLLGFSPDEFNFKVLRSLIQEIKILDPDAPRDHDEYVRAFKRGEVDQYRVDLRSRTRTGEEKWLSDCSVPIREESTGRVIGSLGILQDITKRKKVEEQARLQQEQLIHADKMVALGTLVSGVAHEINNPNNFIMLNTPLLLESWESVKPILDRYYAENGDFIVGGLNYSEMRDHIPLLFSGIVEGAKRIRNIVLELRDFARQHPAEFREDININAVVNSALTLVSNMIKKSTNHFHVKYGTDLPKVRGNFQRLEQVIINLIQNACQSLPDKNKAIHVATSYDNASAAILVQVKDEGIGIPPEMMKHICDPFFTTKRDEGGSGLGLSITANIINEHGGHLDIASEVSKGTSVSVILPLNNENDTDKQFDQVMEK